MKYLHTMVRVLDLESSLNFYCDVLGLKLTRKKDFPDAKFSLIFLATEPGEPELELTHNWKQKEKYTQGRNFGHLAYEVEDIYQKCQEIMDQGVAILRPPRDGRMAFIKSPEGISIELLQKGEAQAPMEPWISMENSGTW